MTWPLVAAIPVGVAAVLVWWLRRRFVVVTVEGVSMLPTYRDGDRVLVRRASLPTLRRGQVVVVGLGPSVVGPGPSRAGTTPARPGATHWMIKRVHALPGDPVPVEAREPTDAAVVPTGRVILLGDNPDASFDSRQLGFFHGNDLLGPVIRKL